MLKSKSTKYSKSSKQNTKESRNPWNDNSARGCKEFTYIIQTSDTGRRTYTLILGHVPKSVTNFFLLLLYNSIETPKFQ